MPRASGSRGTPGHVPSTPASRRRPAARCRTVRLPRSTRTRRRTGEPRRAEARLQPSELLPPDDVANDDRDSPGGQDRRQQQEEPRRRTGELGRVAPEFVDRIYAALPRRAVLPEPTEDGEGQ